MKTELNRSGASVMRIAGAGALGFAAYLLGTQGGLEREAAALPGAADAGQVVINQITPPAIVISENQRAVVGAADGLFYLVDYTGHAVEVQTGRRERRDPDALFWHPGPLKY